MWFESMTFAICCILLHVTLTSNNIIVLILQNVFAFVGFFLSGFGGLSPASYYPLFYGIASSKFTSLCFTRRTF